MRPDLNRGKQESWKFGVSSNRRFSSSNLMKLLVPGIGIKRWVLLGASGVSVCSIGFAYLLRKVFALSFPDFLPGFYEGFFLLLFGGLVIFAAFYGFHRSVGPLVLESASIDRLANTIYTRRHLGKGPHVVVLGGGTGLSVLLRGMKKYTDNITAIVTVGDDGGSSGRLRRELGVLPPGDFRNCLVALSDDESLVSELFQYRFDQGEGLQGHNFGNLFIAAMTEVTNSFEQALYESSRVLAAHGRIIPATMEAVTLSAILSDGNFIEGESNISEASGGIERLMIRPETASAHEMAVDAICDAQLVIIGPGSLYTSILPNILIEGIRVAIEQTNAKKIYICNVATQKGETEGYSIRDHHNVLKDHSSEYLVDYVIANNTYAELGERFYGALVKDDGVRLTGAELLQMDLVSENHPVRHDSQKLAKAIMEVYDRSGTD